MMNDTFEEQITELIEKHMPVSFLDCDSVQRAKNILLQRDRIGRREILIVAYLIGADANESNELLRLLGHPPLYVKRREDAIWRFALNHRLDSASVINEIFPQNVDEISEGK